MKKKMLAFLMAVLIVVGIFPVTAMADTVYVAQIGETKYATFAEAYTKVKENSNTKTVITLLQDCTTPGFGADGDPEVNYVVDLNNHTLILSAPAVGSSGTETQAIRVLQGSTAEFKNGTLKIEAENKTATSGQIKMFINKYGDLTLDKVTVDGTNLYNGGTARYVVSNNCGTTTIKDSKIIAVDGDFAFDSCKYASYEAPTVNVEGSTITGKVEVTGGTLNFEGGKITGRVTTSSGTTNLNGGEIVGRVDAYDAGTVIVNGTEISNTADAAVVVWGDGTHGQDGCKTPTLEVKSGAITGSNGNAAISTNGSDMSDAIINISGGVIKSENDVAVYAPSGIWTISGGDITGKTAMYFKSEKLTVSGGNFVGTGEDAEYVYNGNGCNATGDALVIDSCGYPNGLKSGDVSITGGTFESKETGTVAVAAFTSQGATAVEKFISGGTFSSKPDFDYLAEGYYAKEITKGTEWKVMPMEVVVEPVVVEGNNIKIGETKVEVKDENGESITDNSKATAVAQAITNTFATEAVYAFENTKIEDATEGLKPEDVGVTTEGATIKDKQVNVKLKSVEVEGNNTAFTITRMEFDVKPMAVVTTSTGTETKKIPNSAIKALITFRLPVDSNVTDTTVAVYHKGVLMGTYEIQTVGTEPNVEKYIEVQSKEFSTFAYELLNANNATAEIDGDYYATLANAIEKASGKTVTIIKDTNEDVIVERAMNFKLEVAEGKNFNGAIRPGDDYVRHIYGNNYYFELYEAGDTIVIGGKKAKDTKTETKEENPETGAPVMNMGVLAVLAVAYVATRKH